MHATDADSGSNGVVTYRLRPNTKFRIDGFSGTIFVNESLIDNFQHEYSFDVVATDGAIDNRKRRYWLCVGAGNKTENTDFSLTHAPMFVSILFVL